MRMFNGDGAVHPIIQGFVLCISLIMIIGPQNMFILRQGLQRRHLFMTAMISTLADVVLISLGVGGMGAIVSTKSILVFAATGSGALFLFWCGVRSLLSVRHTRANEITSSRSVYPTGLHGTVIAALSFSLLNPAAYLDTIVIIGSKSLLLPIEYRIVFGLGAMLASTVWFFSLTYGASRLSSLFLRPATGRTLDCISGCIMLGTALMMVRTLLLPV